VTDQTPGIRRKRAGEEFTYTYPDGSVVRDRDELRRIRDLVIPPAWTDVWICPSEQGHLQVTGRDARGRKQYRYHPRFRDARDATKFGRMVAFGQALPGIRERVDHDLRKHGLPREKLLATVVRLLRSTSERVGNEEYARDNNSFGLTTLRDEHAEVIGSKVRLSFRGKSGKEREVDIRDAQLARIVRASQGLPGEDLFQYVDDDGATCTIGSSDVNEYLREISGQDFTAKDFRTWSGTVLAAMALRAQGPAETEPGAKRKIAAAIKEVAQQLGNTPAVCRKSYVHPAVIAAYKDGSLFNAMRWGDGKDGSSYALEDGEAAVLALLERVHS
jgi:DNA topoisomerase-1